MSEPLPEKVYRTLLRLDVGDGDLRADEIHRISMDLFPVDLPDDSPRRAVGVLTRRDGESLLVQSLVLPTRPTRGAMIVETGEWYLPQDARLVTLRARLAAEGNTSSGPGFLPQEARRRSARQPIPPGRRREWAVKKLSGVGLLFQAPPRIAVGDLGFAVAQRPPIPFVDIAGTALVTDMGALHDAVVCGVGRGRSYGFGLLDVAIT